MGASPAAAAHRIERRGIRERLEDLLDRSCPGSNREISERLLPAGSSAEFSWLSVPRWLATSFGVDATPAGRVLVDDLCWLQFCVFGVFRVQDDLIDGDSRDPRLALGTHSLLAEAARCAALHFDGRSPFWRVFQETIDATSRAILELGRLQRSPDRDPDRELRLYADLSACLKIAAAGVTFAAGRERAWTEQLSPALDAFTVATQIVDDLRDIREDLDAGCINHAAWCLSHPLFSESPDAVEAVVASNLATTDRLDRLLARAASVLDRGMARLDPGLCPAVHVHLSDYRRGLVGLGQRIQRSTVVMLAGSAKKR